MSAFPSAAAPKPSPAPQKLEPEPIPQRSNRRWLIGFLALVILVSALWLLRPHKPAKPAVSIAVRTVRAVPGVLRRTLRLTGSISAKNFASIFAPLVRAPDAGRGVTLLYLVDSGTFVKKGQVVARMDDRAVRDHLDDVEAMVNQSEMDLRKIKARQAARMEATNQAVRTAKAHLDMAKEDLLALAVKSRIDGEILRLAVDEAQATYQDALREVPLVDESQQAELRIAEVNQEEQVRHRDRHRTDLLHFTIESPMEGQVVLKPIIRNGEVAQVRAGDQLGAGQPFMRVVDLSHMQVDATISQTDSELVHVGQPATVHFDAYPNLELSGRVAAVGTLAVGGRRRTYYVHSIPVRIDIDGSDPRVIPDLTASADVIIGEKAGGLLVPRQAVQESGGKPVVYVKQGDTITPRTVEIGAYSATEASITSGIQQGEEIAVQPDGLR